MLQNKIKEIDETIILLKKQGVDFEDRQHYSDRYTRYIKKFEEAKILLGLNNDVSNLVPLRNPFQMIHNLYHFECNEEEKEIVAIHFKRSRLNFDVNQGFDNLDLFPQ